MLIVSMQNIRYFDSLFRVGRKIISELYESALNLFNFLFFSSLKLFKLVLQ